VRARPLQKALERLCWSRSARYLGHVSYALGRAAVAALSLWVAGCNSLVMWRASTRSPLHQLAHKIAIYVAVSPQVAAADDGGNILALVDALEAKLRASGREVSVIAARLDETPPVPRIELQFQSSEGGDPQMRGAGQLVNVLGLPGLVVGTGMVVHGSSGVVVDIYAVPDSGPPTFTGRVSGTTFGNASDSGNVAGAESAGESIARRLLN
jgi:hypothetical protein